MSKAKTGRVLTEEHKIKISEGNKGKVYSAETRAKMSASIRLALSKRKIIS